MSAPCRGELLRRRSPFLRALRRASRPFRSRRPTARLRLSDPVQVSTRSPMPASPANVAGCAPSAMPSRVISASPRVMSAARELKPSPSAFDDARRDGHDVLQRAAQLDADDVVVRVDAKVRVAERLLHRLRCAIVVGRRDDRRRLPRGDFRGEARSRQRDDGMTRRFLPRRRRSSARACRARSPSTRRTRSRSAARCGDGRGAGSPRRCCDGVATQTSSAPSTALRERRRGAQRSARARTPARKRGFSCARVHRSRRRPARSAHSDDGVAVAREEVGERRAPRAGADDRVCSVVIRLASLAEPMSPHRARSRAMFARCVQNTNSAMSALTTNSGERGAERETRAVAGSTHRRDQAAERDVAGARARRRRTRRT